MRDVNMEPVIWTDGLGLEPQSRHILQIRRGNRMLILVSDMTNSLVFLRRSHHHCDLVLVALKPIRLSWSLFCFFGEILPFNCYYVNVNIEFRLMAVSDKLIIWQDDKQLGPDQLPWMSLGISHNEIKAVPWKSQESVPSCCLSLDKAIVLLSRLWGNGELPHTVTNIAIHDAEALKPPFI